MGVVSKGSMHTWVGLVGYVVDGQLAANQLLHR